MSYNPLCGFFRTAKRADLESKPFLDMPDTPMASLTVSAVLAEQHHGGCNAR